MSSRIFFLIGGSGVGKTAVGEVLNAKYSILTFDMDSFSFDFHKKFTNSADFSCDLVSLYSNIGPDKFFEPAKIFIEYVSNSYLDLPFVFDVGVGFFYTSYCNEVLRTGTSFKFEASAEVMYERYKTRLRKNHQPIDLSKLDYSKLNLIIEEKINNSLIFKVKINAMDSPEKIANKINGKINHLEI